MNDPTLIANTTSGDGDTRKWLNSRKKITSVASNEPVDGDWIITGDLTLKLRAERSNKRTSRIYTITIVCTDPAGNRSTKAVTVTVPRN